MKKSIALFLAALLLGAAGCVAPVRETAPAPAPTLAPVGMRKVFGRDVTIACDAARDGWFAKGVQAQADKLGVPVVWVKSGETAGDGMIACFAKAPVAANIPTIYVSANGAAMPAIPADCYGLVYDAQAEAEAALQAMYAYPSHEAPVRVLGMFAQGAAAHDAYLSMAAQGKLQDKGALVFSDGLIPGQAGPWLEGALSGVVPGRLDTVFTDGPALAMEGFAALRAANRGDAVEICTAGLLPELLQGMMEEHFLMGVAVGQNQYGAGKLAVRMLAHALSGSVIEENYMQPQLCVRSDEVGALYRAGVTDINAMLEALDEETERAYQADFLDELRENHTA